MTILNIDQRITQAVESQVTALRIRFHSGVHRSCGVGHVGTNHTPLVLHRSPVRSSAPGKHRAGTVR